MQKNVGKVFWFTGLSGAGKTTLATRLKEYLIEKDIFVFSLDGDILRQGISKDLGFDAVDRKENVRRAAWMAKMVCEQGGIVLCCLMSPLQSMRIMAKEIIGEAYFYEIFIHASIETCIQRDTKGLYKKALAGEIKEISGIDAVFEEPQLPNLLISTDREDEEKSFQSLVHAVDEALLAN